MSRTLGEVVCWAQRRLSEAGIEETRLEARLLVADAIGTDTAGLISEERSPTPPGLTARLAPLLDQRAAGKPLAHIIGQTEFYGLPFHTDARALIPRSDSETVVQLALELLPEGPAQIADLGTGSGCLLVAILANQPRTSGQGIDLSADALALAKENAALNGVADRAAFHAGSWADWQGWSACDLILSNPPYIESDVIETLETQVREHEPRTALDGGPDGLAAYREIITLAATHMKPGAHLVLEIGYDQREAVAGLLEAAGFADVVHRRDLGGNDRAIAARCP